MKTALLRFAPVFTPLMVDDAKLVREYMVERGAIVPMSYSEPTPVVVNHDEDRQIRTVREFAVYDDVISGKRCAPYYFAHVDITEPTAMRRGDGVSWGYHPLRTMELAGTRLIRRALIREVSVLAPPERPAEVFARVVWVGELPEPKPKVSAVPPRQAAAEHRSRSALDRLYFETFGTDEIVEDTRARLYAEQRAKEGIVVRHGVGQVLGVR